VFPGTSLEEAAAKVDAIRLTLAATPIAVGREVSVHVTVSAGVASAPAIGTATDTVLATADGRLFKAKHGGRNCVVTGPGR
jgi:diguanylate cyclase (GGDEF)-like protein